ncbi:MAG TPA: hypothetical protein PKG56_00040 [Chitinophagaceae bacterium]|nr:hypothetical protein [Chitinophagaceae bacterium]HNL81755.1 hypothetical protein [Chitinophagaceae bacterium]
MRFYESDSDDDMIGEGKRRTSYSKSNIAKRKSYKKKVSPDYKASKNAADVPASIIKKLDKMGYVIVKKKSNSKKSVKGGVLVGAGKKQAPTTNPWIRHVKKYAKEHGIKYAEAISMARASYRPMKGGSKTAKRKSAGSKRGISKRARK